MKTSHVKRFFPDSEVAIFHQNGLQLTPLSKGLEVLLHTRENEGDPCCAELLSGEHHAEIGLWFEGHALSDFDGVFFLPREVAAMLEDASYTVPEDCLA